MTQAPTFPGRSFAAAERHRFANGFELVLLPNSQAPIVTSVLVYRAGGRDESAGASGAAHFLEHMMFKGSGRFGPGEIDRRTQALGGVNNAFTSHDQTAYYFAFAADRWQEALEIERDRMTSLTLDPAEIASERQVILEELAMYRDDPWDDLELAVQSELYAGHPYAVPVLGREEDLERMDRDALMAFYRSYYDPANALLVVSGELDGTVRRAVEEAFASLPGTSTGRPLPPLLAPVTGERRVERVVPGAEVNRMLVALPAPAPDHADFPGVRMLSCLLGSGRSSRLHREFVDVGQRCLSADCALAEMDFASHFVFSFELLPGVDPEEIEARLDTILQGLRDEAPGEEELERARRVHLADWVFQLERIHQQAIHAALAAAQGDILLPERQLAAAMAAEPGALRLLAERYLDPRRGVVRGLSRPAA
ncbi:MAG: M16 family metallopeptidase [Thermoanaerobaculia bacterium]